MNNIVITGASGLVATELTFRLLEDSDVNLTLISTHPDKLRQRYAGNPKIRCLTLNDFSVYCRHADYKAVVHAAFARSGNGRLLVQSVEYTRQLLEVVRECNVRAFVNVSSQSVYGVDTPPLWTEDTPLSPVAGDMYALAKTFTETLTGIILKDTGVNYTNIRLSSVCENARFLRVFVDNALAGKPIQVQGGDQRFSFIDVRDVASALADVIGNVDSFGFRPVYNLGTGRQSTLLGLAEIVKRVAEEQYGIAEVQIIRTNSDDYRSVGMDNTLFKSDFSWHPSLTDDDMVVSLFEYLTNVNRGGYPIAFKYV